MNEAIPRATHEGRIEIGGRRVLCAVLEDGSRVLSGAGFLRVLGRRWRGRNDSGGITPKFLSADNLKPYLDVRLRDGITPIEYRIAGGKRMKGFAADLLPAVCKTFIRAREAGALNESQIRTAAECDLVMMELAKGDIINRVDEATGFTEVRERLALQELLRELVLGELLVWARRIPDEFFKEMFRLRGWIWKGMVVKRPSTLGRYTNDLVFERLAQGVLMELLEETPKDTRGRRRSTKEPWVTGDIGHQALENHIYALIGLMRASANWQQFYRMLQRSFPKQEGSMLLIVKGVESFERELRII